MQGLALVLEDFLAGHVFGVQHATLGGPVHVLHQVARQCAGQQCVLLFDEGAGRGIGQVLDGFTAQDSQFASARIVGTELAIGLRQVIAHQA
ncbi:hypothetical protein D9M73_247460 [compost metagenome]